MRRVVARTLCVSFALLFGGCCGAAARVRTLLFNSPEYADAAILYPLPHHVPKYRDGISFRFAMAHDVVHERFAKHGPTYYRERDRLAREKLAKLPPGDPARFPLIDDIGVGLDRLGKSDEAVSFLRGKLTEQEAKGLTGRDLYTSYANLGTFLIHGAFAKALAGDPGAKERMREGISLVRKSVEVNPEAHFGREQWQAAVAEFLLATMNKPELLREFDCLGNRLDAGATRLNFQHHRAASAEFGRGLAYGRAVAYTPGTDLDDPKIWPEVIDQRKFITEIGAHSGWDSVPVPSHREPVKFDEPMLGLIGMWRQGGGANPHFALAIGETMLRVGQRYIAWCAFERAALLADRYSPDPATREFLREHCRKRKTEIEESLSNRDYGLGSRDPRRRARPLSPPEDIARLGEQFREELAYGQAYQKAYQDYEAAKIAAGVSIDAPGFFDAFHAEHPEIASKPALEEWIPVVPGEIRNSREIGSVLAHALFCGGVLALATAGCFGAFDLWRSRRPRPGREGMDRVPDFMRE